MKCTTDRQRLVDGFPHHVRERLTRRSAALIVGLLAGCVAVSGCSPDGALRGVAVLPPRELPALRFTRADGSPFLLASANGQLTVVFFGYTHCPDICPMKLADWQRVKSRLGTDAAKVRFVFVSVDPERDTPDIADRYAKQFDSTFVGLSGDSLITAQALGAFSAAAIKEPSTSAAGYMVSHSSQVFLVDGRGRLVALYAFGSGWDTLLADLQHLL